MSSIVYSFPVFDLITSHDASRYMVVCFFVTLYVSFSAVSASKSAAIKVTPSGMRSAFSVMFFSNATHPGHRVAQKNRTVVSHFSCADARATSE
jgi:hypothetical protein